MSDQHLDTEDVAAMRRQGDFRAFMRQAIKTGQQAQRENLRPAAPSLPAIPGHVPGAWPVGRSDDDTNGRKTCVCARCRSYAKNKPEQAELLRRAQNYLDGNEVTE